MTEYVEHPADSKTAGPEALVSGESRRGSSVAVAFLLGVFALYVVVGWAIYLVVGALLG